MARSRKTDIALDPLARSNLAWLLICVGLIGANGCRARSATTSSAITPVVRDACLRQMRNTLRGESGWPKVHAAEFLTALDYRQNVRAEFELEMERHGDESPYRIGIWRVLAQLDRHNPPAYARSIRRIVTAFSEPTSPDRIHAVESLAKLGYAFPRSVTSLSDVDSQVTEIADMAEFARDGPPAGRAYALWVFLNNGASDAEQQLQELLRSEAESCRRTAAYVLRHRRAVTPSTMEQLEAALSKEPRESPARVYLLSAVLKHDIAGDVTDSKEPLQRELTSFLEHGTPGEQFEASRLLADIGDSYASNLIATLRQADVATDVKSSVAHALCRIGRRHEAHMSVVDWGVVGCYAIGMLVVGVYYARRMKTTADYVLGGRNMRPWAVGLSLFATLLSTLSYLAWPGEMIKNGPIILMGYAAHPLIFLVVGWFLIPRIMQMQVTSAYEILETRFGLSIRLLGSFLFLSLRLLWMASIIYWTTTIVLLPAAGLKPQYAGYVALILGIVTVVYTSLGGLRAVVMTDVIQTFILFAGAIAGLVIISYSLGGVREWLPDHWAPHWNAPRLWFDFDPQARSTLANAMLGTFCWYVCTAGSDQMAIQRYLATRDIKAARRTLAVSLSTDLLVVAFLGLMGLALLAFFSASRADGGRPVDLC